MALVAASCAAQGDPPPIVAPLAAGPRGPELPPLQPSHAKAPPPPRDDAATESDDLRTLCTETCDRAAQACPGYDVATCVRECKDKDLRTIYHQCPQQIRAVFACTATAVAGHCPTGKTMRTSGCDKELQELMRCVVTH